ncbi:MAG: hypothetical protein ABIG55_06590 [Candidatus Omnitrophota bacterium]|nr:hypothetical protein [Candidatus Omnitrophota bacterium]
MGAKTRCKKGYDTVGDAQYVEFKDSGTCPVSGASECESCKAEMFVWEPAPKKPE